MVANRSVTWLFAFLYFHMRIFSNHLVKMSFSSTTFISSEMSEALMPNDDGDFINLK